MTPDKWKDLARFAGFIPLATQIINADDEAIGIRVQKRKNCKAEDWTPLTDWNDFGPLWVKLKHWRSAGNYFEGTPKYLALPMECRQAWIDFGIAEITGDEKRIMQAGCLLGAAIGATMKGGVSDEA